MDVSSGVAAAVLAAAAVLLLLLRRRPERPVRSGYAATSPVGRDVDTLDAMVALGEAMSDANYTVNTVRETLDRVAQHHGLGSAEVIVLPTAIIVSSRVRGQVLTRAVSTGFRPLTFHQVDSVDRIARSAREGTLTTTQVTTMARLMRDERQPFRAYQRVAAYAVASGSLSVLLGASLSGVGVALVLGLLVGILLGMSQRLPDRTRPLITFGSAFIVSVTVFWLLNVAAVDAGALPSLVAPLVIFLPGAMLTTSVVELTTGQIVSGGARLAAGFMQLILLALGIVAAGTLVGVPAIALGPAQQPLGAVAPWLAVGVFGISIGIHQRAAPYALPWITALLYVAYSVQVLAEPLVGAVIAAFVAALVMTPVAAHISRHGGPPAIVPFRPAFWLLVPGALGLVGVTTLFDTGTGSLNTIVATVSTMVAVALGILAGSIVPRRRAVTSLPIF